MSKKFWTIMIAGLLLLALSSPGAAQVGSLTDGHKWSAMTADQKEFYVNGFKSGEYSGCMAAADGLVDRQYKTNRPHLCVDYNLTLSWAQIIALLDKVYEQDQYKMLLPANIIDSATDILLKEYGSMEEMEQFQAMVELAAGMRDLPYDQLYQALDKLLARSQGLFRTFEEHPELKEKAAE